MIEAFKEMILIKNLAQIFHLALILKEEGQEEITENASKLNEKYNDLAREALSNDDKILAENYFQHADHFVRVLK